MKWMKVFSSKQEALQRMTQNKPQLVIIDGKRICLVRRENEFFAIQDSCTHNGDSLSKGKVNFLGEIVCPWHHYRFDLRSGRACDSSCADLESFHVRLGDDGLFIGV
jgi:nitrite reductase/ring-hydroxylating ferredoxin subunit